MKMSMRIMFFSIVLLFVSCNMSKQTTVDNYNENEISFVSLKSQFHKDEEVKLVFENNIESEITILNPQRMLIEKNYNNKWERVKILYCPCGASCPQPPKQLELKPSEKHIFTWNQKEDWCGDYITKFVQKTETKFVGFGKYRIKVLYKIKQSKIVEIYKYFEIIE